MKQCTVWLRILIAAAVFPFHAEASTHKNPSVSAIAAPPSAKNSLSRKESALLDSINAALSNFESRADETPRKDSKTPVQPPARDSAAIFYAHVPRGRPLEWIAWTLSQAAGGSGYKVSDCALDDKKQTCTFTFTLSGSKVRTVTLSVSRSDKYISGSARLALIGEVIANTSFAPIVAFLSMSEPLALSVIEGKRQTRVIAQLAQRYHKEMIVRLPMEPESKIPSDFDCPVIMVNLSKDAVHTVFSQALKDVPHCAGFNNFWGARVLEDSRMMTIILNEIKKSQCYFLESKGPKNSQARLLSASCGVAFESMTGLIPGTLSQIDCEKQLRSFAAYARNSGAAIVSIAVDPASVNAIKAMRPWFKQNGVALVFPSRILQNRID